MEKLEKEDKARMLDLKIYDLMNELYKMGKDLANDINKKSYIDVFKSNFLDDLEYILLELNFIEEIAEKFDLVLTTQEDINEIKNLKGDERFKHFMPNNFNWEEQRFYTEEEENILNEKRNKILKGIIKRMKLEGKI